MTRKCGFGLLLSGGACACLFSLSFLLPAVACSAQHPPEASIAAPGEDSMEVHSNAQAPQSMSFALEYGGLPDAPSSRKTPTVSKRYLNFGERVHLYGAAVLESNSIIAPGVGATFGQLHNAPQEWGPGDAIYARRVADSISRQAVAESIRFGLAAFDGEDPRYHRSEETGFFSRTRHVLLESFTSQTADGGRIPAFSRFAGAYGSAFLSTAWHPEARYDPNWALRRGSSAFASGVGLQLIQEFIPQRYLKRFGLADKTRP